MRLFSKKTKNDFTEKMKKNAHLSTILVGWQNGLHIRKERPIFDLGLSWFVFVTLETSCINNISKKPLGRWNDYLTVSKIAIYSIPTCFADFDGFMSFFSKFQKYKSRKISMQYF